MRWNMQQSEPIGPADGYRRMRPEAYSAGTAQDVPRPDCVRRRQRRVQQPGRVLSRQHQRARPNVSERLQDRQPAPRRHGRDRHRRHLAPPPGRAGSQTDAAIAMARLANDQLAGRSPSSDRFSVAAIARRIPRPPRKWSAASQAWPEGVIINSCAREYLDDPNSADLRGREALDTRSTAPRRPPR